MYLPVRSRGAGLVSDVAAVVSRLTADVARLAVVVVSVACEDSPLMLHETADKRKIKESIAVRNLFIFFSLSDFALGL